MSIINEQFVVSNVTADQYRSYFQEAAMNQPLPSSVEPAPVVAEASLPLASGQLTTQQQELMIREFSAKSNLNLQWSKQ